MTFGDRASGRARPLVGRTARRLEWTLIGVALFGLALMCQPFVHALFGAGFRLLCGEGVGYVSTTFWRPGRFT